MKQAKKQPGPLHPIAAVALEAIEDGGGKLTADGERVLRETLAKLADDPELGWAVDALVRVAAHLDLDRKNRAAADVLLAIATSATVDLAAQIDRGLAARQDRAEASRNRLDRFCGKATPRTAPVYDAPAPAESKPLRELRPPPRKTR